MRSIARKENFQDNEDQLFFGIFLQQPITEQPGAQTKSLPNWALLLKKRMKRRFGRWLKN